VFLHHLQGLEGQDDYPLLRIWHSCLPITVSSVCSTTWTPGIEEPSITNSCWDRGFEFHRGHGCLPVGSVVCCQVVVSATSWSLVQKSSTDCGASLCVI
jgi:hypothetical protein